MTSRAESNNFDALRICAASAVLYSHHHALTGQPEPLAWGTHTLGGFAVLVFFTISGYLATASWCADPNVVRFSARRVLRIWPAYTAVIVLSTYVLGPWVTDLPWDLYGRNDGTFSYLGNIGLVNQSTLPGVFVNNPVPNAVNDSLRTIPFGVACFVLLAIAGALGALRMRALWLGLIAAVVIWYQIRFGPDFHADWKLKREMVVYFLAGSAVYMLAPHWQHRRWQWGAALALVAGLLWLAGYRYLALLSAVPYLVVIAGRSSTPVIRRFGRWGDPSYGLYLFAFPVQQTVIQRAWPELGFATTLCLALLVTLALAYLSWHALEKHALGLKPYKAGDFRSAVQALRAKLSNPPLQRQLRFAFSAAWLGWMLMEATQRVIQFFPAPDAELNSDAYWTYLPNARRFLADPWTYWTTHPSSFEVAPLGYLWPAVWGADPALTQLANCGLYLLCILLMWRLATRLGGMVAGMVSTALLVWFPDLATYVPQVLTESPYMFGLLLCLTSLTEYVLADRRRGAWLALAAAGLSVTLLSRPVLQLYMLTGFVGMTGFLAWRRYRRRPPDRWSHVLNRQTAAALALALSLPALTVLKNGLSFDYWGLSTGAGAGLFYGVSPFKMGVEPVYGGFSYDTASTTRLADPSTGGQPLRVRSDQILVQSALSIVQSTSWSDNAAFFGFKLKAWTLYGTEELHFLPALRQYRLFEWLAIICGLACLACRRWGPKIRARTAAASSDGDPLAVRRLGLSAFTLLLVLGMIGQLAPVLNNVRYNTFLVDLLLMPLAGVGVAITAKTICAGVRRPDARGLLQALAAALAVGMLIWASAALTESAVRRAAWSMDPLRPGPTALVLGHDAMGPAVMSHAEPVGENRWRLGATSSTLTIPLRLERPLSFGDGIWRFKLAITPTRRSRQCQKVTLSLDRPSPEIGWYAPQPILHVTPDGTPRLYAIRGNGQLRPAASGNLHLVFQCPAGTLVHWQGAQLLRSTMPEAARALITAGTPIDPYRADDLR